MSHRPARLRIDSCGSLKGLQNTGLGKIIPDPTQAKIPTDPDPDCREYIPGKDCPAGKHLDGAVLGHQLVRTPAGRGVAPGHNPDYGESNTLKGLSHEIDFKNVDENGQILALIRATAGF